MESHKKTPRDRKWLLPALETEGRGQRSKRKLEHSDNEEDEPIESNSKVQKQRRENTGDKTKQENKIIENRKQTLNNNNGLKTVEQKHVGKKDPSKPTLKIVLEKIKVSSNVKDASDCEDNVADKKKSKGDDIIKGKKRRNQTDTESGYVKPEENKTSNSTGKNNEKKLALLESTPKSSGQVKKPKKDVAKKKSGNLANRKYSCNFCGLCFIRESSLAEHIKWQHRSGYKTKSTSDGLREWTVQDRLTIEKDKVSVTTTIAIAPLPNKGNKGNKGVSAPLPVKGNKGVNDVVPTDTSTLEAQHVDPLQSKHDESDITDENSANHGSIGNVDTINTLSDLDKSNIAHGSVVEEKSNERSGKSEGITSPGRRKVVVVDVRGVKDKSGENMSKIVTPRQESSDIVDGSIVKGNSGGNTTTEFTPSEQGKSDIAESKGEPAESDAAFKDPYEKFLPETISIIDAEERETSACPFCHKTFSTEKGMKTHVELRCTETPYRCFCGKGLMSEGQKHKHRDPGSTRKNYYVKQADLQKAYTCQRCQKGFSFQVTYDNHLLVCKGDNLTDTKNKVECKICHKYFSKSYYRNHMLSHSDRKTYVCEFCGGAYNTGSQLWTHVQNAHKGQRFTCDNCGAHFTQKAALQNHKSVFFGKCKADKEYKAGFKCELCSRTFTSFRWLTRHQESHVVPDYGPVIALRDFNCTVCGKLFKTKHEQIRHERIHFNEKPHKCTECEMAFVQKCNLISHMRIHTGERPFTCHLCSKSFTQQSNLKAHLWKHSAGKISPESADKEGTKVSVISASNKTSRGDVSSRTRASAQQVVLKDNTKLPISKPVIVKIIGNTQTSSVEGMSGMRTATDISNKTDDLTAIIDSEAELVELSEGVCDIVDLAGKVIYVDESGQEISEEVFNNMQTAGNEVFTHVVEHDYSSESSKVVGIVKENICTMKEDININTLKVQDGRQYSASEDVGRGNVASVASDNAKAGIKIESGETVEYISDSSTVIGHNDNIGHITTASSIESNKDSIVYISNPLSNVDPSNNTGTIQSIPDLTANIGDKDNTADISNPPTDVDDSVNTVQILTNVEQHTPVTRESASVDQKDNIVYVPYAFTGIGEKNKTIYVPRAYTNEGNKLSAVPDAFTSVGNKSINTIKASDELSVDVSDELSAGGIGDKVNNANDTMEPVKVTDGHLKSVGFEPTRNVVYFPNMVPNGLMNIGKDNENQDGVATTRMANLATVETVVPGVNNEHNTKHLSESLDASGRSFKDVIDIPKPDMIVKEAQVAEHVKESSQIVQEVLEALCQ